MIDQYRAHVRIIYDELIKTDAKNEVQKLLFEERIVIEKLDVPIWKETAINLKRWFREHDESTMIAFPSARGTRVFPAILC